MDRPTQIENYVKSQKLFDEALSKLKKGRELAIRLHDGTDVTLVYAGGATQVEFRPPKNADVCFEFTETAFDKMISLPEGISMANFGIEVVKLVGAREVRIKILTGPFKMLAGGYIEIIRAAGGEFFSRLGEHGIRGPGDVIKVFRKLKKS